MPLKDHTIRALRHGATFGALLAGANLLVRIVRALLHGNVSFANAALATLVTFVLFGGLAFALILARAGAPRPDGQIEVSPWFGWLFVGVFVAFFVGLFWGARTADSQSPVPYAIAASLAWVVVLGGIRVVVKLLQSRGA